MPAVSNIGIRRVAISRIGSKWSKSSGSCVELEILRDAVHAPGFGALRLEGAQHHLAGVGLVIGAFVGHAQDGQVAEARRSVR
jgi:hypothetical protein